MKGKFYKKLTFAGILVFSAGMVLTSCGGDTVIQSSYLTGDVHVKVNETTQLTLANAKEGAEYLWVSANEAIATVDQTGLVTGVKEGTTKISCYQKDDFTVVSTLEIVVYEGDIKDTTALLELDTTQVKTVFKQGEVFTSSGLIVKKDGVEITDFYTNPAEGTYLLDLGTFDVYVSSFGAESVSYQITVEPVEEDLSLVEFVEDLSIAASYQYDITIEGQIDYGGEAMASEVTYAYTFGDDDYYYEIRADGVVLEGQNYGYTKTSKGVMKFRLDDEVVQPICYSSIEADSTYRDFVSSSLYNDLNADKMPRRLVNGEFTITDQDLISSIISNTNLATTNIYQNLEKVVAYFENDALTFEIDCGLMGTIKETYSKVGTASVPYIDEYIETNGEDIAIAGDLTSIISLVKSHNYSMSLGRIQLDDTEIDVGTAYYAPNYVVYDYTSDYIEVMRANGEEVKDYGLVYIEGENYPYTFNFVGEPLGETTTIDETSIAQDRTKYSRDIETFREKASYPSQLEAYDHPEMYEYRFVSEFGANLYLNQGDDYPTEIYDFLGLSLETTGLFPYGIGLYGNLHDTLDALSQVYVIAYVFDMSGTNYCLGLTLTGFGATNVPSVETYLESLAGEAN